MAEALLKIVCENLNSLIQRELGLFWGVKKEMEKLSSTLSTIRAVLEDAEEKKFKDKAIQNWLQKLKDIAYDVDDILDECATEALRLGPGGQSSGLINKVHTSFLIRYHLKNVMFRFKIGKRMKEIRERLDEIAAERMRFHLREGVVERRVEAIERRQTCSVLTQPLVCGREGDKGKIVELLVKHVSNCEDVSICPVIGMGGLGKTTLAQLVFNDERVNKHFDTRIWVCVSEDFDVKRLIRAIIESSCGRAPDASDLEALQRHLREMLNGKRYLLVLDDVWNQDQEKWDRLKYVLACGSKGASIIVTTRIKKVASIMGTLPPHHLLGLSEDDCWSLFKQRAFGSEAEERPNLVAIGKDIVRKCGGVPLAAKALGGLMRFKREENEWLFVKESEIWNLPQDQDENSILPALRLSYSDLPLELRQCFAFCAIFPKDSIIEKRNIIDLWMANGFIPSNGKLEPEDIGNQIWNELYWRSFFQDLGKDYYGEILNFKMHDLVHDLAQSVADECCIMGGEKEANVSKGIRHVGLVTNSAGLCTFLEALYKVESLRTLHRSWRSELSKVCSKFGFLRVLVARDTRITTLPSSIGQLKHLRYLDLSFTQIRTLPESICSLQNLQTLGLDYCHDLQSLPKQMRRLRNLQHLYLEECHKITQMPPRIGQLTCLTWLSFFIVGERRGFQLGELQGLNLRGELRIKHLERVKNLKDAKEANLVEKQNLRCLNLSWECNGESDSQANAEDILEGLEPHPSLEQLSINEYKGTNLPLWLRNLVLKNVVCIRLSNCKNCLELPLFGKLASLKTLDIYGMNHVEYIDNESNGTGGVRGFPSLETLRIWDFPNLKRLSREEGRELLPCLTRFTIGNCHKLTTLPCLPSLKELVVWGCNEVLLSSISNLHSLPSLSVGDNSDVISFPNGILRNLSALQSLHIDHFSRLQVFPTDLASLVALKTLAIEYCKELECLPEQELGGLTSLQHLKIRECIKFKSLSEGLQKLTALETLDVSSCPELVALPMDLTSLQHLAELSVSRCPELVDLPMGLTSLQRLAMAGCTSFSAISGGPLIPDICSKMVVLPEALQHAPALQSLSIMGYSDLASLPDWLGNLTSLQSLRIECCPKLASLPTSIQSLTKLQTLSIRDCPELERRCEKESGEDWYKINHIPNVNVDNINHRIEAHTENGRTPLKRMASRFFSSFSCA